MIELNITEQQIERAKEYYDFYNIKNSFTKGKSQLWGALGEILIIDYYNIPECNVHQKKDYDVLYDNRKVDVKTKVCTSKPSDNFFCSVSLTSFHQQCDDYLFVRILKDKSKAWICGWIDRESFYTKGQFFLKDKLDPTSNQGFRFKEDCMNVPIYELNTVIAGNIDKKYFESKFKLVDNEYFIETEKLSYSNFKGQVQEFKLIYKLNECLLSIVDTNKNSSFSLYVKNITEFEDFFEKYLLIKI